MAHGQQCLAVAIDLFFITTISLPTVSTHCYTLSAKLSNLNFTNLKLYPATATNNSKYVTITHIRSTLDQTFENL